MVTAVSVYRVNARNERIIVLATPGFLSIEEDSIIGLGGLDRLLIGVEVNDLTGVNVRIVLYEERGFLTFTASNPVQLNISAENESNYRLSVSGGFRTVADQTPLIHNVYFTQSGPKQISWVWNPQLTFVSYTYSALGVASIGMMVVSGIWFMRGFNQWGAWDARTIERLMYCFTLFMIGFGLFIGWVT